MQWPWTSAQLTGLKSSCFEGGTAGSSPTPRSPHTHSLSCIFQNSASPEAFLDHSQEWGPSAPCSLVIPSLLSDTILVDVTSVSPLERELQQGRARPPSSCPEAVLGTPTDLTDTCRVAEGVQGMKPEVSWPASWL